MIGQPIRAYAHFAAQPRNRVGAAHEAPRRTAVRLLALLYVLYLAEGALRKWIMPGAAGPLFFLRDPFVLALYAWCLTHGLVAWSAWTRLWFGFAVAVSVFGFFGFVARDYDPIGWVFGVRTYWLYLPLAFIVPAVLRGPDLARFIRLNLLLALPYAGLMYFQYYAGPGHWINHSYSGDENLAMVVEDVVRPYGLFTYTSQNVVFVATLVGLFVAATLLPRPMRPGRWLVVSGGGAILVCALLTGSRAIYFLLAGMFAVSIAGGLVAPRWNVRLRTAGIALGFASAAGLAFVTLLSDAAEHIAERQRTAAEAEGSTIERAVRQATAFVDSIEAAPLLGEGIGLGTTTVVRVLDLPVFVFGENELERVIYELGPFLGLAFVLLRLVFAIWLVWEALRCARRGNPAALAMAALAAVLVQNGSITYTTLVGFQAWLAVGLTLALMRLDVGSGREARVEPPFRWRSCPVRIRRVP